jgi:hypothetical protein
MSLVRIFVVQSAIRSSSASIGRIGKKEGWTTSACIRLSATFKLVVSGPTFNLLVKLDPGPLCLGLQMWS